MTTCHKSYTSKPQPPLTSPVSTFGRVGDGALTSSFFSSTFFTSGGRTLARACKDNKQHSKHVPHVGTNYTRSKAILAVIVTLFLTFQAAPSPTTEVGALTEVPRHRAQGKQKTCKGNRKHVHRAREQMGMVNDLCGLHHSAPTHVIMARWCFVRWHIAQEH